MNWEAILDAPAIGKPPYQSLTNAVRVIEHDPRWAADRLWHDAFGDRTLYRRDNGTIREWRDDDDVALTCYLQDTTGLARITKGQVRDAVELVARRRSRHPVRDYLAGLTWDGEPRIDHAIEDHWGAECGEAQPCPYVRAASRNLFIGLVARVMRPGCKLDTMVVFEGVQGARKSSALDVLGGHWYAAIDESAATKDFLQCLRGKWLIEIAEMNAFSRAESAHVKGMLSRRTDTYRASYGYRAIDVPRQCVFAGSTNRDDWHTDETGGRRFWPIRVGDITLDTLTAARDQLFAEAAHLYALGADWWTMPDTAAQVQSDRYPEHAWTDLILTGLAGQDETTMYDVLTRILRFDVDKITMPVQKTVGDILRHAHWWSKPTRRGKHIARRWFAPDYHP